MVFARASAVRGALRSVRPSIGRAQQWRQVARRGYASHGHDTKQASSDLPWLVGALAVTVPSCWYLIKNGPEANHGHGEHGGGHGDKHDEEHSDEHEDKEAKDESESSDDDKSSEKDGDSETGDESKDADTPDTSEDEGENEDGQSKVATSSETPATPKGDKKVITDSKGGNKKRTDSEKGEKQGKPEDMTDGGDTESKDKPASSKTAGNQNTQSGKQEGLSNTDTKHSVDLTNNPEKSRKGEGTPETSKAKGTLDPKRPQA